ncbi:histone-lysine N-methyltransferase SUV39H2-like [Tubulanus polymorphus]|uniref:histone-lysine N-methyltransferase SUV39H2-like n=1 Tax=Tubulanus polymorphus TaxID=672921 RepID=UPI003DA51A89
MAHIDECFVNYVSIPCLSGVADIQNCAAAHRCTLSEDANTHLLHLTLKKLGPTMAQKVVMKLIDAGKILLDDKDREFEVEKVLDHQMDEDTKDMYYFVKWKGWNNKHNTWEPADNLIGCLNVIDEYNQALQMSRKERSLKRKRDEAELDGENSNQNKIQELIETLKRSKLQITPLTLLQEMSNLDGMSKMFIRRGLLTDRSGQLQFTRKRKPKAPNYANKKSKSYKNKHLMVQKRLKEWEEEINRISLDPAPISVVNEVDLEGPPENFVYINDYLPQDGIVIPQDPMIGCTCDDCYAEKSTGCCPSASGTEFAYYLRKRVRLPPRSPIYECNKRCKCGPECPNRVVQLGRKFKVAIFRTANGKGWGVRALQKIKRGSFVMEYVGEVITTEEAERRGKIYDGEGLTYLFDLDYQESLDCPYTVDAGVYGNVSHFVNHSCEPNLAVYCVWINTLDPHLPRIALFSTKDIDRGEELSFDYRMFTGNRDQSVDRSLTELDRSFSAVDQSNTKLLTEVQSPNSEKSLSGKSVSDIFESSTEVTKDEVKVKVESKANGEPLPSLKEHVLSGLSEDTESKSLLPTPPASLIMGDSQPDSEAAVIISSSYSPTPGDTAPSRSAASPLQSPINKIRIKCQCGAKKCRGFLF